MADLDQRLPSEALVKIMSHLGVQYFRWRKGRVTSAKRYSDDFRTLVRLLSPDETVVQLRTDRLRVQYVNSVVQFHHDLLHVDDELTDAIGIVIAENHRVMTEYHRLLGTMCTCRAWVRGVEKYLDVATPVSTSCVSWHLGIARCRV